MINKFVADSWPWVVEQVDKMQEMRERFPQKTFEVGEYFTIMGLEYSLKTEQSKDGRLSVLHENGNLIIKLPENIASNSKNLKRSMKSMLCNYYEELGKKILSERVFINSQKLQLYPQSIIYRNQKTRWGSCSSNGNISLNWRLIVAPLEVIDYVVIHELCHLRYHNHSKSFWKLVEQYSPRWKKVRKWLQENQYSFDFLIETSELHPEE